MALVCLARFCVSLVQFKMATMRSEKPICVRLRCFSSIASNSSHVRLTDDGPSRLFKEDHSSLSSHYASLLQAVDGVKTLVSCALVRSVCVCVCVMVSVCVCVCVMMCVCVCV